MINSLAQAELVSYIEDAPTESSIAPVSQLSDLVTLYTSRIKELGLNVEKRVHSTKLKERILASIPDLKAHPQGKQVVLAFESDIGHVLSAACDMDYDNDAVVLAKAARIIRRGLFDLRSSTDEFSGSFDDDCQTSSVPVSLLGLVRMIHEGPNIKDQNAQSNNALAISQLIAFNTIKRKRKQTHERHTRSSETPLSIYLGLLLHAHTRKKDLVDKLSHLGLCISYHRVLRLSADLANSVCRRFEQQQVVCPPKLRTNLFTTAAVDNIDHNPSSTTATDSSHGTGISMFQHPKAENEGQSRDVVVIETSSTSKAINTLQESYTTVPPLILPSSTPVVPPQNGDLIGNGMSLPNAFQCEKSWLENVFEKLTQGDVQKDEYISWAAYHASLHNELSPSISLGAMLSLFKE